MCDNSWEVIEIQRVTAKKVIAYVTVRYGAFEFRNLRVLPTPQGLVALFPGASLGQFSIPYVLIRSDVVKHQLQEAVRAALA